MSFYKSVLRPVLFSLDSETVHEVSLGLLEIGAIFPPIHSLCSALYAVDDERLQANYGSLSFKNPVGLAAGFDKDAKALALLSRMGFGFIEVGTVTREPQIGNPRPRIHRLVEDRALINSMGFPSKGAAHLLKRLKGVRIADHYPSIGINLGKNKDTPLDIAEQDYVEIFKTLKDSGDYFVVNVSSPNTPELRKLQEPARLTALLRALQQENTGKAPLFLKIAPDLEEDDLEDILEVCDAADITGIIACNTTRARSGLSRESKQQGGLSGPPLFARSKAMVAFIRQEMLPEFLIIGVGGISGPDDAIAMLRAGANALQIYTAFVYEGPRIIAEINRGILACLEQEGKSNVSELVGRGEE